jgi:hypothetical protein
VEVAEDVGATLHIEPNDTPTAGKPTPVWFALTRKGGKVIPLEQCNCQLAVKSEPHTPGSPPLLNPPLKPVSAERYQGIPGAEITFPKPGAYQLHLSGKPADGESFQPFELNFDVTVAVGTTTETTQDVPNVYQNPAQAGNSPLQIGLIALSTLLAIGIFFVILQRVNGKRR